MYRAGFREQPASPLEPGFSLDELEDRRRYFLARRKAVGVLINTPINRRAFRAPVLAGLARPR